MTRNPSREAEARDTAGGTAPRESAVERRRRIAAARLYVKVSAKLSDPVPERIQRLAEMSIPEASLTWGQPAKH